jgi:hypothetical protein
VTWVGVAGFESAASSSGTRGAPGLLGVSQLSRDVGDRTGWRLRGDVAVFSCCTSSCLALGTGSADDSKFCYGLMLASSRGRVLTDGAARKLISGP